ncbi:hypothetical protein [Sulfuriflexus mobilis]|uniref:hypothetical protein n=1 Tax=Sulfuriflexus mobilis TaxID=1811807 RepID=UPI000F830F86|nr:hypothetical protein [Sulfuriflexus mobilis]
MNTCYGSLCRGTFLSLLIYLLAFGTSSAEEGEVNPGKVSGTISFINTSPDVAARLSANPVTVPANALPVKLYRDNTLAASGAYAVVNTAPDSNTYQAASYVLHPDVEETGSDFHVLVNSMLFADTSTYRFASSSTNSVSVQQCPGVLPETVQPAGTVCDVNECAALLGLQYKFVPDPAEPDILMALDPNVDVVCTVSAYLEDPPGSNTTGLQAATGELTTPLSEMIGAGAQAQLLVRASAAPVSLTVSCQVKTKSGEEGFVIIPSTGFTPLDKSVSLGVLACGETQTPATIEIPVERNAGRLIGYFDINGYDEAIAQISLDTAGGIFSKSPPLVAAGTLPTEKWEFKGAPQGPHSVIARTVLDNGDKWLMLPHRNGLNGQVTVVKDQITDINVSLISKPVKVQGNVLLFDINGKTDLDAINNPAFLTTTLVTTKQSYMEALGIEELPSINGGSGFGGISRGRLNGAYDPASHEAPLNYELLLTGLSPEDGNLDGSDAKPTLWDVDTLRLYFDKTPAVLGGYNFVDIDLAQWLNELADPATSDDVIMLPEQKFCLGKAALTIRVDESLATLYRPQMSTFSTSQYFPTVSGTSPVAGIDGFAVGDKYSDNDAAAEVHISATLPEGFQYKIRPTTNYLPADGSSSSWLSLGDMLIPQDGVIGCGKVENLCANLTDLEGGASILDVSITNPSGVDNQNYCVNSGNLELNITASSTGNDVQQLAYVLDPPASVTDLQEYCNSSGTATVLCTDCGMAPQFPVNLTSLASGSHTLVACAQDTGSCVSSEEYSFSVTEQELALQCTPDFTVELNIGETGIAKDDPRITDNLGAELLGNCGVPDTIADDQPDVFPIGDTTVTFSASGVDDCTTTTTVVEPVLHELAYVDRINANSHALKVYTVELGTEKTFDWFDAATPNEVWVEYDRLGDVLGYAYSAGNNKVKSFDADSAAQTLPPYPCTGNCVNIAYRPEHAGQYAVVETTDFATYTIRLVENGVELDSQSLSAVDGMSRVELAWFPLGSKLSAIFTSPQANDANAGKIHYYQWSVINDAFSTETSMLEQRPIREYVHELLHLGDDSALFATKYTINTVQGGVITNLNAASVFMNALDFTDNGDAAGIITSKAFGPATLGYVWGMIDIDKPADISAVLGGLVPEVTNTVAISSDKEYIAVGTIQGIHVFTFPDFSFVATIPATRPYDLAFRPVGPYLPVAANPLTKGVTRFPMREFEPVDKWPQRKLLPDAGDRPDSAKQPLPWKKPRLPVKKVPNKKNSSIPAPR